MISRPAPWPLAFALVGLLVASPTAPAAEDGRTGDVVLKELDEVKQPKFDPAKREDRAYIESYIGEMTKAQEKRAGLILELLKVDPKNGRLPKLLPERWQTLIGEPDKLNSEIDEAVEKTGDEKLRVEGYFIKARSALMAENDPAALVATMEEFEKVAPRGDKRVGSLFFAASERIEDVAAKSALEDRILKDFPDAADRVKAARRLRDAVGQPFELEFTEAVTGNSVRMADLKGTVVVVDFWATWCGPCVAEMPNMKKLYTEYKDKGVEFIGISLDQPEESGKGLTKLKEFVAKNEIGWPQYYQGKGWEGDFSRSWGINSIPRLFVVGPDGNLFSTSARGKLETMIPELLKKTEAGQKSGG